MPSAFRGIRFAISAVLVVPFAYAIWPLIAPFTASGRDVDRTVTGGRCRARVLRYLSAGATGGTVCSLQNLRAERPDLSGGDSVPAVPALRHQT